MYIEPTFVVSIVAVVVAATSALISFWSYRRDLLSHKMQAAKWQKEYFTDLTLWANECVLLLSEAHHLCDLDPQKCQPGVFFETRHRLRIALSAQIDKGRWFFPNYDPDKFGQQKEIAFRGYRHEILDALVSAYRSVTDLSYMSHSNNGSKRGDLDRAKRLFTSEIQKVLAPASKDAEFKKLTSLVGKI